VAMYEAVVAGMPAHRSLAGQLTDLPRMPRPTGRGRVDWPAALTGAVHGVLGGVLPFAAPDSRGYLDAARDAQLAARRSAGVPDADLEASRRHGRAVADALTAWAAGDGYAGTLGREYTPPTGQPHYWESTPPNFRPAVEPHWSQVRPLVLRSADEVEPAPHVPFSAEPGSPFWEQAMAPYRQSFVNTDEHKAIARFWTDNPGSFTPPFGTATGLPSGHWMQLCALGVRLRGLDLARAVEVSALVGVALHDAFLNCWTWKYRFQLLRPVTYVRRYIDPGWSTFVNSPQFPEYTSGHSVASPAAAAVLTDRLGVLAFTDDSHASRGLPARSFASFDDAAAEAAVSRLYGGIHYPMAIEEGLTQGRRIGQLVLARVRTRR
jgi:PAP2 superfamily